MWGQPPSAVRSSASSATTKRVWVGHSCPTHFCLCGEGALDRENVFVVGPRSLAKAKAFGSDNDLGFAQGRPCPTHLYLFHLNASSRSQRPRKSRGFYLSAALKW